jgi:glycosyltransferase involved in cell wall biosynthesis
MKIFLINNLYGKFSRGGAERIVKLTADGFVARGHEVMVITTRPFFSRPPQADGLVKIRYFAGLYYYVDRMPKILRLFFHLYDMFDCLSYFKLRTILKNEKPDLVITHNLTGIGFWTPALINKLKIKHVHTLHDIQLLHPSGLMLFGKEKIINSMVAKIYQTICKKLFSRVPVVISPSHWLLREHVRRGFFYGAKQVVLPNPAPDWAAEAPVKEKTDSGSIRLLYAGQVEEHKGVLFLIKALSVLKNDPDFPAYKLTLAGPGTDMERARIEARGNGNIEFTGRVSSASVELLMRQSDYLIVPSLCYENSPTVIYEAVSLGLPVIASRLGGIIELTHEFGGILFNPGDKNDFAGKLIWAAKNPAPLNKQAGCGMRMIKNRSFGRYLQKLLVLAAR